MHTGRGHEPIIPAIRLKLQDGGGVYSAQCGASSYKEDKQYFELQGSELNNEATFLKGNTISFLKNARFLAVTKKTSNIASIEEVR